LNTQIFYLFDAVTGEFKGPCEVEESPLDPGVFNNPTYSTQIAPPAVAVNEIAVYASGTWSAQLDYRGQTIYNQSTGASEEVVAIGVIPVGYALTAPPPTLAQAQASQLAIIVDAFATASVVNVTDSNGVIWSGGMSSAVSIYGAVQLSSAGGAASVTLFDTSNLPHTLTTTQGTAVAAAIGSAYQTVFAKYQGYKVAIAAAKTVAAVQEIVWE